MSADDAVVKILGTDAANAAKIVPLLQDAASALTEVRVPTEQDLHELASGAWRFTQSASLESEDTDRRFEEAMKNVGKWREHPSVYLNGAAVLLRRSNPKISRYEAKKRVLGALRTNHEGPAAEHFYFTRETGIEPPAALTARAQAPLPTPPARGEAALTDPKVEAVLGAKPSTLTDEHLDLAVRLLSIPRDPRSPDAGRIIAVLAKAGDKAGDSALLAMCRPAEVAKNIGGEATELLIGIRQLIPKLAEAQTERILRAALEAGWSEWIDRPLLDPPLAASLREKLLKDFGTRQDPRGNPYRPSEAWFYNLDPS
jgi:hypothetical protein